MPQMDIAGSDARRSWLVVTACFCLTLTLGETFWTFGVFFKPLQQEFGWSRALISSIFTAFLLGYSVSVVASGRLVDRYDPKPVLLVSAVLVSLGLCLCSVAETINHLRLFLLIVGLGSGATWSVPNSTVQRWFYRKEHAGLALGIVVSGVGVGAMIFAPLVNHLILSYGWRAAFLIIGILFLVIILAATLMIRPNPPLDASAALPEEAGTAAMGLPSSEKDRVLSTWAFAATTFVVSAGVFTFQVVSTHLVPYATDVGISATASAAALGLMGGFSIPGRILSGLFSFRIGWYRLLSFSFFAISASILCLFFLKDIWMLYLFTLSYGVCHGVRIAGQVGVMPEIFGIRSLGELIGVTTAIAQVVGSFAPYAAGLLFDVTGSYVPAFLAVLCLSLAGGSVAALLKRIAHGPAS